jgi:hypothetical protein
VADTASLTVSNAGDGAEGCFASLAGVTAGDEGPWSITLSGVESTSRPVNPLDDQTGLFADQNAHAVALLWRPRPLGGVGQAGGGRSDSLRQNQPSFFFVGTDKNAPTKGHPDLRVPIASSTPRATSSQRVMPPKI